MSSERYARLLAAVLHHLLAAGAAASGWSPSKAMRSPGRSAVALATSCTASDDRRSCSWMKRSCSSFGIASTASTRGLLTQSRRSSVSSRSSGNVGRNSKLLPILFPSPSAMVQSRCSRLSSYTCTAVTCDFSALPWHRWQTAMHQQLCSGWGRCTCAMSCSPSFR